MNSGMSCVPIVMLEPDFIYQNTMQKKHGTEGNELDGSIGDE